MRGNATRKSTSLFAIKIDKSVKKLRVNGLHKYNFLGKYLCWMFGKIVGFYLVYIDWRTALFRVSNRLSCRPFFIAFLILFIAGHKRFQRWNLSLRGAIDKSTQFIFFHFERFYRRSFRSIRWSSAPQPLCRCTLLCCKMILGVPRCISPIWEKHSNELAIIWN